MRLHELVRTLRRSAANLDAIDRVAASAAALGREVGGIQDRVDVLSGQVAAARRRTSELLAAAATEAANRADVAAVPDAKLRSDRLALEGSAAQRLRVRRLSVGEAVERPFRRWLGETRCATGDSETRALWERLLAFEAACGDLLRGDPSSVLDVPGGTVSMDTAGRLRIQLRERAGAADTDPVMPAAESILAIPRFTYAFPAAKLHNFGHWLVDCLPHVLALAALAPRARFVLPAPIKGFQRSLLALIGVTEQQIVPWNGDPLDSDRWLVLEADGRIGGGRPLAWLIEMRELMAPPAGFDARPRTRRLYVSRRDAEAKVAWISNEADVEAVFRSRGFEILVMSECPLDEQVRLFREAAVVAGVSGAGLTDIVFSSPGIHVIVLLSDGLIRWYGTAGRARAKWATRTPDESESLAALGDSPRFYAHLAATCEQVCHSFLSADRVPLDELTAFVDTVLAQAATQ